MGHVVSGSASDSLRRALQRAAARLWAAPNTLLGAVAGAVVLGLGGHVRIVAGAIEFHGGLAAAALRRLPPRMRFGAITLGHVILGLDAEVLDALRDHEQVHVRQYERWGPFFLPAYAASSAWQWVRGRRPHRDNAFERQAFAADERRRRR